MRGMTSTPIARAACRTLLLLALALGAAARPARAQSFVEYPAHPATYGDHTIAATWAGGPTSVSLQFFSDEAILHADGNGQSQRTARNTLTYVAPSAPTNGCSMRKTVPTLRARADNCRNSNGQARQKVPAGGPWRHLCADGPRFVGPDTHPGALSRQRALPGCPRGRSRVGPGPPGVGPFG